MALTPGTRIGPYEVIAKIGEGGMGEVCRATDTNLKRAIALKVLPVSLAGDPDRLARFQRGAEVLAALNHPNIAQIHGLETGPAEAGHYAGPAVLDAARAGAAGQSAGPADAAHHAGPAEAGHYAGPAVLDAARAGAAGQSAGPADAARHAGPAEAGHYVRALVMELVEGPTLADQIAAQGPRDAAPDELFDRAGSATARSSPPRDPAYARGEGTYVGRVSRSRPAEGEQHGRFHPGSPGTPRFMAYQSDESGQNQIYIQAIPAGAKYQVSTEGGTLPHWRRDGRELYYLSADYRLTAAPITIGASVQIGTPQELFMNASMTSFVPSRDGQRFLVNLPAGSESASGAEPITVVTDWQAGRSR